MKEFGETARKNRSGRKRGGELRAHAFQWRLSPEPSAPADSSGNALCPVRPGTLYQGKVPARHGKRAGASIRQGPGLLVRRAQFFPLRRLFVGPWAARGVLD